MSASTKNISLIAAVGRHGELGKNNQLLWHLPQDMAHFKETTRGATVVMGRKTWESIPPKFRPLPGRRNIVISHQSNFQASGAQVVGSVQAALDALQPEEKTFVIGGAQIYAAFLPYAQELVFTEIDQAFDADTFFPAWPRADYDEISRRNETSEQGWALSFVTYRLRQI
jgi:dihydrofolate reductase